VDHLREKERPPPTYKGGEDQKNTQKKEPLEIAPGKKRQQPVFCPEKNSRTLREKKHKALKGEGEPEAVAAPGRKKETARREGGGDESSGKESHEGLEMGL